MRGSIFRVFSAGILPLEDPAFFDDAFSRIPPDRQKKILSLKFPESRRQSLGVSLLLSEALRTVGLNASLETFGYGPFGKPYLVNHPDLYFNLSHCEGRALCVLSTVPCGCDVERIGRGSQALADRFFAEEERSYLHSLSPGSVWQEGFTQIWTRKESFLKATGQGISVKLNSFSVLSPVPDTQFLERREDEKTFSSVCLLTGQEIIPLIEWDTVNLTDLCK